MSRRDGPGWCRWLRTILTATAKGLHDDGQGSGGGPVGAHMGARRLDRGGTVLADRGVGVLPRQADLGVAPAMDHPLSEDRSDLP